jgi:hypothetical protein
VLDPVVLVIASLRRGGILEDIIKEILHRAGRSVDRELFDVTIDNAHCPVLLYRIQNASYNDTELGAKSSILEEHRRHG